MILYSKMKIKNTTYLKKLKCDFCFKLGMESKLYSEQLGGLIREIVVGWAKPCCKTYKFEKVIM
jgi:hypothetical protein